MPAVLCTNNAITSSCPKSTSRTHFAPHGVAKNYAVRSKIDPINFCQCCRHSARQRIHIHLADLREQDGGVRDAAVCTVRSRRLEGWPPFHVGSACVGSFSSTRWERSGERSRSGTIGTVHGAASVYALNDSRAKSTYSRQMLFYFFSCLSARGTQKNIITSQIPCYCIIECQ